MVKSKQTIRCLKKRIKKKKKMSYRSKKLLNQIEEGRQKYQKSKDPKEDQELIMVLIGKLFVIIC